MSNGNWDSYGQAAEKGPWSLFWKLLWLIVGITTVLSIVGIAMGWLDQGAKVATDEFGPKAALAKYEWFISQAASIQKADRDIALFEQRIESINTQYASSYGEDKTKWMPSIQAQYNHEAQTARDDRIAVVSNRNGLVREYNAQSEKFNWAPFRTDPRNPQRTSFELKQ